LPFVNLSPDRENEYFSDGMTEELITALGRVQGLRVAARASSFAFQGKPLDLGEIGRKLNVETVLDGSVRRSGTHLRVTAELVKTGDGTRLWADRYDRELRDVFAVQDELARAIVAALHGTLVIRAATGEALVRRPTLDLAAHDLYLQGRYLWNQRTYESLLRAATYFERAVALDSIYAEAYAGLADTYLILPSFGPAAPRDAYPKAKRAAERAVALDDSLAEAHASLGNVRMLEDFDWRGAETELRRAIALNPSYATGHQWYAEYLRASARLPEALAEMTRARELDPLSRIIAGELGYYLALNGHYDEALRVLRASLDLDPAFARTYNGLCNVYLIMDEPREAIPACERGSTLSGAAQVTARLAWAYSAVGDRPKAEATAAQLEARARREYVPRYALAVARLAVGDTAGTFAWLDSAVVARDGVFTSNNTGDPVLRGLETDPRFVRLRRRMGLGP
jgi:TolB-like protein